jgi:hypothetical protein
MSKYDGHTPGPWRVGGKWGDRIDVYAPDDTPDHGPIICEVLAGMNSDLIADAPKLLRLGNELAVALREARSTLMRHSPVNADVTQRFIDPALAAWRELTEGK